MRAFFIVVLFFLAFVLFFSTSMAGVNLTSNTPGAQAAAPAPAAQAAPAASQPQVITIQESPSTTSQINGSVPVTGGCTNPYTVQAGDTLSQIAVNCNSTLAAIRQANPQITDANTIFTGQQLNIPNAAVPQPTVVIPDTGKDTGTSLNTLPQPTATAQVPATGVNPTIKTGTGLQVRGINFPPNTPVNVAIGPQSKGYTIVANGVTDASGSLTTNINVPSAPDSQTLWVVVVATTSQPPIQAMSQPFFIAP